MKIKMSFFLLFIFSLTILHAQSIPSSKDNMNTFIENKGQWPEEVLFLTSINGMDAWITNKGVVYDFFELQDSESNGNTDVEAFDAKRQSKRGHVVAFELEGINKPVVQKGNPQEGCYNYFLGSDQSKWATGVKSYTEISLQNMYDKIDLKYYYDRSFLRYDYVVQPGGNPSEINFDILGSNSYFVNQTGELVLETKLGKVKQKGLKLYQEIDGKQIEVSGDFVLTDNGISINVGEYDHEKELIIDPIVWFTFIGGEQTDVPTDIATGIGNNVYVTGYSGSSDFPVSVGAYSDALGETDAFVTKLSGNGQRWNYSTFIGGNGYDISNGIVIGDNNHVYIVGETRSSDFPVIHGYDDELNGGSDAFVLQLDETGEFLHMSSFIGGDGEDVGNDIDLHGNNPIITGYTLGDEFPTTIGGNSNGAADIFVSEFSNNNLVFSYLIGGNNDDVSNAIDVEGDNVFITGYTNSENFPITGTPYSYENSGFRDVFVACINRSDLNNLVKYSTYIGGDLNDEAEDIYVLGNTVFITGYSYSYDYPSDNNLHKGDSDAFYTKLDISIGGGSLFNSELVGGTGNDVGNDIILIEGSLHMLGSTNSEDIFGEIKNQGYDAFFYDIGDGENYFFGSDKDDHGIGLAYNGYDIYIAGSSAKSDDDNPFPGQNFASNLNPTHEHSGEIDGFVVKWAPSENVCGNCGEYIVETGTVKTWPQDLPDFNTFENVRVESGATLIIEKGYDVLFCTDGRLTIESGGRVELYGGLTSCEDSWEGVRMEGEMGAAYNYSMFYSYKNAEVSNAVVGIANIGINNGLTTSMGLPRINCNETKFVNNRESLFLYSDNSSGVKMPVGFFKCSFIKDDDYSGENGQTIQALLWGANNILFSGCDFVNRQTHPNKLTFGILGVFSSYSVGDYCAGIQTYPCPDQYVIHSSFSGYTSAISNGLGGYLNVKNARFDRNAVGIRQGLWMSSSSLLGNVFSLQGMPEEYNDYIQNADQIGISYSGAVNGMNCQDNQFYGDPTSLKNTIGIHVRDIGTFNNDITENSFYHLKRGNVAEGINADAQGMKGLNYLCNKNYNSKDYDFHTIDISSVRKNIGKMVSMADYAASRNQFSFPATSTPDNGHFFNEGNMIFFYHRNTPLEVPVEISQVTPKDRFEFVKCPSDENGPFKYALTKQQSDENVKKYFYHSLSFEEALQEFDAVKISEDTIKMEQAQKAMAFHQQEMDKFVEIGYGMAISDTVGYEQDTVRVWLRRFKNQVGDYMLASDFIRTKEYAAAHKVILEMPHKYNFNSDEWIDYTHFKTVFSILENEPITKISISNLEKLVDIADRDSGMARYLAQEIMGLHGKFYPPVVSAYYKNGNSDNMPEEVANIKMKVSPNPTDYYVVFDWEEIPIQGEVVIEILDQVGTLIEIIKPGSQFSSQEWTTQNVSGSICYYRLLIGGVEVDSGQIIVNR